MFVTLFGTTQETTFHVGLVLAALGFGFRHGIDWDHIAALTDIVGSHKESRRSMICATFYALGHALMVLTLGLAAIVLAARLPSWVDGVMEHVVGLTLIILAVYVVFGLLRHGRDFRMQSRWMLIFGLVGRAARRVRGRTELVEIEHEHQHDHDDTHDHQHLEPIPAAAGSTAAVAVQQRHTHRHRHIVAMPPDPFTQYRNRTAFLVGVLHGIGAETPTQVLLFVAAAGAGGTVAGVALLVCFLIGLVSSNTLIAAAGTFGFLNASRNFRTYAAVSLLTAGFSLTIGALFLFGRASALPAFFGG